MDKSNKVLTVSIAAYNVQECLSEALESCLIGSRDALEIIVVNDGSTDGTLSVAKDFEKKYPDLIKVIDKKNGGYGSTINSALNVATGKYFRYLDGDDWFEKNALEDLVELLSACDADAVYSPLIRVFTESGREVVDDGFAFLGDGDQEIRTSDFPLGISPLACSWTYRTAMLREMDFFMSERLFYSDTEFAVEPVAASSSILITHAPLYRYRIGREGQSVSLEGRTKHYKDAVRVVKGIVEKSGSLFSLGSSSGIGTLILDTAMSAYSAVLLAKPSSDAKKTLIDFDRWFEQFGELYSAANVSGAIRLLRRSSFLAYRPLSVYKRWIERRKQSQCP